MKDSLAIVTSVLVGTLVPEKIEFVIEAGSCNLVKDLFNKVRSL